MFTHTTPGYDYLICFIYLFCNQFGFFCLTPKAFIRFVLHTQQQFVFIFGLWLLNGLFCWGKKAMSSVGWYVYRTRDSTSRLCGEYALFNKSKSTFRRFMWSGTYQSFCVLCTKCRSVGERLLVSIYCNSFVECDGYRNCIYVYIGK